MSAGAGDDSGEPDLTPILDMVFQLITFFKLVCNFKAAAMDLSLSLPVVVQLDLWTTKGPKNSSCSISIRKDV